MAISIILLVAHLKIKGLTEDLQITKFIDLLWSHCITAGLLCVDGSLE